MRRIAAFLAVLSLAFPAWGAPALKARGPIYVDLQEKATHTLAEDSASGMVGNNLSDVPTGEKVLGGIKFNIGKGYVQLGCPRFKTERPEKVEGIKVDAIVTRLHILHATCFHVADDTVIAVYRVHYKGGDTHTIEVVYGKDVRDYWFNDSTPGVKRGKVVWEGDNEAAKKLNNRLRLYLNTWENPKPSKRVVGIDFVRSKDTPAAPFCIAMTIE